MRRNSLEILSHKYCKCEKMWDASTHWPAISKYCISLGSFCRSLSVMRFRKGFDRPELWWQAEELWVSPGKLIQVKQWSNPQIESLRFFHMFLRQYSVYVPDCPRLSQYHSPRSRPFFCELLSSRLAYTSVPVPGPLAVPSGKAEESDSDSKKRKQKSIKLFLAKNFWNSVGCWNTCLAHG